MSDSNLTPDPDSHEWRHVGGSVADEPTRFLQLMGHLYRGEVSRSNAWRARLDRTTNWAVVITASLITWGFSTPDRPHYVMLVGMVMVTLFLFIESRRYRIYDIWRSRIRLLEENVWANALHPNEGIEHREWRDLLSEDLRAPALKMPMLEAVSRRLRRIYLPLLVVLLGAWFVRVTAFDHTDRGVVEAARIARIPGALVWLLVVALYFTAAVVSLWPMRRHAKGELTEDVNLAKDWKEESDD